MRKLLTPFAHPEQAAPSTPDSGFVALYAKTDKGLYTKDSAGLESALLDGTPAAWTAWTPTLSGGWLLGNATYVANYARVRRMIFFYARITVGTTTTKGSGFRCAYPLTPADTDQAALSIQGFIQDVGASTYACQGQGATSTTFDLRPINAASTYALFGDVSATAPATWVTGDIFNFWGQFEAAA